MPKISVIMPAYNAEKFIKEAIDSILGQSFDDFELIIINDCSKDGTEDIILSYEDRRIVYVKNERNMGVAATLNRGLDMAIGEYIARMDADDISLHRRLEKQIKAFEADDQLVACGAQIESFCNGETIKGSFSFPTTYQKAGAMLILHPPLAHPTVMMRADLLREQAIKYDLQYEGTEDFALWWELAKHGRIRSIDEVLLRYRIHKSQATKDVSLTKEEIFRKFAAVRLTDIGVSQAFAGALYDYTCDKAYPTSLEELQRFIAMLIEIYRSPVAQIRFDKKELKKLLRICAMRSIHMADISEKERMIAYRCAQNGGLTSFWSWIRGYVLRLLRRIL